MTPPQFVKRRLVAESTTRRHASELCLHSNWFGLRGGVDHVFLPLDVALASRAVFVIVSWTGGLAETLLEPAK